MADPIEIANEDMTLEFSLGATPPVNVSAPDPSGNVTPGTWSISPTPVVGNPSAKTHAPNSPVPKGVYRGGTLVNLVAFGYGSCQGASTLAPGTIEPTALKTKLDNGLKALRKGDQALEVIVSGIDSTSGLTCTFPVNVKVKTAGQTKVKAQ